MDASYLRTQLSSTLQGPEDYHSTISSFYNKKKVLGTRIRHPYICNRCRRLKLQGYHGSVPPKNFCICPPESFLHPLCNSPATLRLPSAPLKNFIATGTAIYTKTSEFPASDMALTRIAHIIKSSHNEKTCESPAVSSKDKSEKFKFLVHPGNNSKLIKSIFENKPGWTEGNYSNPNEAQFIWQATSKNIKFIRLVSYLPAQIINHFEYHCEVSNKLNLFNNLAGYCSEVGEDLAELVPATFPVDLRSKRLNSQVSLFVSFFKALKTEKSPRSRTASNENISIPETHYIGKNIWLIKPADYNRGRGIKIFNTLESLKSIISELMAELHSSPKDIKDSQYVIQKYIESPLLIENRKFDIRVWVLVTHKLSVYFYKEGYIRTSSQTFSLDDETLNNKFVHLTNNAIQKESEFYSKFELGNQLSFASIQDYFILNNSKIEFAGLIETMKKMISLSFAAVKKKINLNNREFCFEVFGFDFIVDSNGKIWLIECNTNPCIELSSPLLESLIPRMLVEAFELTVDRIFPIPGCGGTGVSNWEFLLNLKK